MKNKQTSVCVIGEGLCGLLLLLVSIGNAWAVELIASVDRNPVSINESFKLVIRASESPDDDPDFSQLTQDFEILNQQQSSRSSWVNGQSSKVISWNLNLMAKREGSLQIPSIPFGDDQSNPIALQVVKNQSAAAGSNEALYLDVAVSDNEVYVQAQVIYTVRLFQRVSLAKASLTEPQADNVMVEKLGDDTQFNTQVNGVNYTVIERKYALFPQKSGSLTIAPLTLTAQVVSQGRPAYGSIYSTQQAKTTRIYSVPVQLTVLAAPAQFTAKHWLAAEQLHLEQTWSNKEQTITVGEPLTRTLTLLAKGVTASQLPEFTLDDNNTSLKTYPDQAVLKNQHNADGVIAFREQKIALIPSKPGQYQVKAIEIPWFNTITGQQEIARLPAITITAVAKEGAIIDLETANPVPIVELPQVIAPSVSVEAENTWKWLALSFAVGWLLTLLYLVVKRLKARPAKVVDVNEAMPLKTVIKQLEAACKANDAVNAKLALTQWLNLQYPGLNLDSIMALCGRELQDEILGLNQYLYSQEEGRWSGAHLAELVRTHLQERAAVDGKSSALEPLHRL